MRRIMRVVMDLNTLAFSEDIPGEVTLGRMLNQTIARSVAPHGGPEAAAALLRDSTRSIDLLDELGHVIGHLSVIEEDDTLPPTDPDELRRATRYYAGSNDDTH